jgi:hypothetical protein
LLTDLLNGVVVGVLVSLEHRCLQGFGMEAAEPPYGLGTYRLDDPMKVLFLVLSM